jgi:hypothetical protein
MHDDRQRAKGDTWGIGRFFAQERNNRHRVRQQADGSNGAQGGQ